MGVPSKDSAPPAYSDSPTPSEMGLPGPSSVDDTLDFETPEPAGPPPAYQDLDDSHGDNTRGHYNPYYVPMLDDGKRNNGMNYLVGGFENNPAELERSLCLWGDIPPAKMVKITGTHTETKEQDGKKETNTVTDFDIKIRLTEYLKTSREETEWRVLKTVENHEKEFRGTVFRKKAKRSAADLERPKPTLKEWCHRYDASHAPLKIFYLTREVLGLDEYYIEDQIRRLVRSSNYKGTIKITFPIDNPGVEVWSNHWINRWRNTMWICIMFYVTFLWILTWPCLYFATKKYTVVKGVWYFSREDNSGHKSYASCTEETWFRHWKKTIYNAVVRRSQGTLTIRDLPDLSQRPDPINGYPVNFGAFDNAVGVHGAGLRAHSVVNQQLGWGLDT